jgi:hypothetical protein
MEDSTTANAPWPSADSNSGAKDDSEYGAHSSAGTYHAYAFPYLRPIMDELFTPPENSSAMSDITDLLETVGEAARNVAHQAFLKEVDQLSRYETAKQMLGVDTYDPISSQFPNLEYSLVLYEDTQLDEEYRQVDAHLEKRFFETYNISTRNTQYLQSYVELFALVKDVQNISERWVDRKRENPRYFRSVLLRRLAQVMVYFLHYICDLHDFLVQEGKGYASEAPDSYTTADQVVDHHIKYNIAGFSATLDGQKIQSIAYLNRPEVTTDERVPLASPSEVQKKLGRLHYELFRNNPAFRPKPLYH